MSQHQQFITIDSVINDYIDETEQSNHKYFKLYNLAFRGMDMLGLDFFYKIKSVKQPLNANFTFDLPADYRKWTKVGVLNSQGEIIPMGYNDKLTYFADQLPDRLEKTQDNSLFNLFSLNAPVWYNYWNGDAFITLYGLPSGAPNIGTFKIDEYAGIGLLNESFQYDYVMLEYVSSPSDDQQYMIPSEFREALIAWLAWKDSSAIPARTHINLGDKAAKRHEFFNERRLAFARYRPLSLESAYQWSLSNQRIVVKV